MLYAGYPDRLLAGGLVKQTIHSEVRNKGPFCPWLHHQIVTKHIATSGSQWLKPSFIFSQPGVAGHLVISSSLSLPFLPSICCLESWYWSETYRSSCQTKAITYLNWQTSHKWHVRLQMTCYDPHCIQDVNMLCTAKAKNSRPPTHATVLCDILMASSCPVCVYIISGWFRIVTMAVA